MSKSRPAKTVKSTATITAAFTSLHNLLLILGALIVILNGILTYSTSGFHPIIHPIMGLCCVAIAIYIWAILTRELDVNSEGILFKEAWRNVSIDWASIEAIKYELRWGQIILWRNNKKVPIYTPGLEKESLKAVLKELEKQVRVHNIVVR
ncbi:MAG: hypothetical protein WAM60_07155 [Candidatus Promineifilaceae bacterium]